MNVLIACEFSGVVRDAFIARGHNAVSCDLLPSEKPGPHIQGSVVSHELLKRQWDLMIAFPDCTFLTVSGARYMGIPWRAAAQEWAVAFVKTLWAFPIPHIAIENPIGRLSTLWCKPTQIIQPWQFGHGETKATCLWLKGLPKLTPTCIANDRVGRVWKEAPSPERWKNRSRTYEGIGKAMAAQWG